MKNDVAWIVSSFQYIWYAAVMMYNGETKSEQQCLAWPYVVGITCIDTESAANGDTPHERSNYQRCITMMHYCDLRHDRR